MTLMDPKFADAVLSAPGAAVDKAAPKRVRGALSVEQAEAFRWRDGSGVLSTRGPTAPIGVVQPVKWAWKPSGPRIQRSYRPASALRFQTPRRRSPGLTV